MAEVLRVGGTLSNTTPTVSGQLSETQHIGGQLSEMQRLNGSLYLEIARVDQSRVNMCVIWDEEDESI